MRSFVVIFKSPRFSLKPNIIKTVKQLGVQKLLSNGSIFTINEGVLHGFARLDELYAYGPSFIPAMESVTDELRTIVTRMDCGVPLNATSRSRTRVTLAAGKDVSASMAFISGSPSSPRS